MHTDGSDKDRSGYARALDRTVREMRQAGVPYQEAICVFQVCFIERVLHTQRAHLGRVAGQLQVHPNTLTRLLRTLGIDVAQIRAISRMTKPSNRPAAS